MKRDSNEMRNKGRGRPKFLLNKTSLKELEDVISSYRENVKPRGTISINSIVKYSKELYQKEQVKYLFSEHFWKNGEGRDILERKNQVIKAIVVDKELTDSTRIIDTRDAVEKLYNGNDSSKKRIINSLIRNEKNLIRVHKENSQLKSNLEALHTELENVKKDRDRALNKLKSVETTMFSWLDASVHKDSMLTNIITTGKSRNSIVKKFFESAFDQPLDGYKKFEEYRTSEKRVEETTISKYDNQKVIEIKDKNKESLYNFKF